MLGSCNIVLYEQCMLEDSKVKASYDQSTALFLLSSRNARLIGRVPDPASVALNPAKSREMLTKSSISRHVSRVTRNSDIQTPLEPIPDLYERPLLQISTASPTITLHSAIEALMLFTCAFDLSNSERQLFAQRHHHDQSRLRRQTAILHLSQSLTAAF